MKIPISPSGYFDGRVDEIRISDNGFYPISGDDIIKYAISSVNEHTAAMWHFNDGAGSTKFLDASKKSLLLPLFPYAIAYSYKLLKPLLPSLTLEKVAIFYPVVAFAITLPFFFLLTAVRFNLFFAPVAVALGCFFIASIFELTVPSNAQNGVLFLVKIFGMVLEFFVGNKNNSIKG